VHNETLSVVAVRISKNIVCPLESTVETQPQLQPALLRLSPMIPNTSFSQPILQLFAVWRQIRSLWMKSKKKLDTTSFG
jgi:hypothetical protein